MSNNEKCKKCKGTGEHRRGEKCKACHGSGQVLVTKDEEGRTIITPTVRS